MSAVYRFSCPYCFQRISSEENVEGRPVECPSCSRQFLATLDQEPTTVFLGPPKVPPPSPSPRVSGRRSRTLSPGWLWPSVAGVAAMIVVGGFLFYAAGGRESGTESYSRGLAYRDGDGVDLDPAQAFRQFFEAAEQGHAGAQLEVAKEYLNDEGAVPVDFETAVGWLRKSEAQGNLDARANLGWCLANGYGVTRDPVKAEALMRDAAGKGNLLAMSGLARIHSGDVEGFEANPAEAFRWYLESAAQGDRSGQYNLGRSYLHGVGTRVDPTEGWAWIERAAEQGFEPALADLRTRSDQAAINELQYRFQQQVEENMRSRPQGANPFSGNPYTQRNPPQYRDAERRAYEGLGQQGYSDEVLREQGYR
jgi:TPR repeat protein